MNETSQLPIWVTPLLTTAGLLLVVAGMWWQHRSNLLRQAENLRNEFRLRVYRRLADAIETASERVSKASAWPGSAITHLMMSQTVEGLGIPPGLTDKRIADFLALDAGVHEAVIEVISVLEQEEIAIPGFRIFVMGLSVQMDLHRKAFSEFWPELQPFIPVDVPEGKRASLGGAEAILPKRPGDEDITRLDSLAEVYSGECTTALAYLRDLSIEAQNRLLGPLFGRQIRHRAPRDPEHKVIRTDPKSVRELEKHFLEHDRFREHMGPDELPSSHLD